MESFWDLTKNSADTLKGVDPVIECVENDVVTDSGDSDQDDSDREDDSQVIHLSVH